MYELSRGRDRIPSETTRPLPVGTPPAAERLARGVSMPTVKIDPPRSKGIATHVVRQRKTPIIAPAPFDPSPIPTVPPSATFAPYVKPLSAPEPPAAAATPLPVVTVRKKSGLHFGPGEKAILILAALSVLAVIISTILTQI